MLQKSPWLSTHEKQKTTDERHNFHPWGHRSWKNKVVRALFYPQIHTVIYCFASQLLDAAGMMMWLTWLCED